MLCSPAEGELMFITLPVDWPVLLKGSIWEEGSLFLIHTEVPYGIVAAWYYAYGTTFTKSLWGR